VVGVWSSEQYRTLDYSRTMRWMIPGALLLVLGAQAILSSFFLSILGLKRR
jgi:voltage-gated potassium channel Kch